jgi:outer membrane protein OmpA-like peptidoglycan-associated protein
MKGYRALLLGSVGLGLVSYHAYSRNLLPIQLKSALNANDSLQLAAADDAAPAAEAAAPVTEPVTEAPAEAAPAKTGGGGVTSYYGDGQTPDADKPWAAAASMNPDYAAGPPASVAAAEPAAALAAETAPAPVSLGGQGVTSYYGDGQTPDADKPWAAPAAMNPDYTAEAPAPAAAETAPAPAAEAAAPAAADVPAPVSLGGVGVTSYYGDGQTPDAGKPWAAPATMNTGDSTQPAAAASAPSAAPAACHDALTAALKAGTLNFEMSSWDISPDSFRTLDKIAKIAKDCGGLTIEVGGHTDSTGKPASNKTLSELRAQAVVKYLVRAGVDAAKFKAVGYGQDRPIGDNDTREGRAQNRRIEFSVTAN